MARWLHAAVQHILYVPPVSCVGSEVVMTVIQMSHCLFNYCAQQNESNSNSEPLIQKVVHMIIVAFSMLEVHLLTRGISDQLIWSYLECNSLGQPFIMMCINLSADVSMHSFSAALDVVPACMRASICFCFCCRQIEIQNFCPHLDVWCEHRRAACSAAVRSGTLRSLIRLDGTVGSSQATGDC